MFWKHFVKSGSKREGKIIAPHPRGVQGNIPDFFAMPKKQWFFALKSAAR
jgi:hypothetical protein